MTTVGSATNDKELASNKRKPSMHFALFMTAD
jgi:hypothetical protein